MRYRHRDTGREYESRGNSYIGGGAPHSKWSDSWKVPVTDENGRSTVVYRDNLEALVDQRAADADPLAKIREDNPTEVFGVPSQDPRTELPDEMLGEPEEDPRADEIIAFEHQRHAWALQFAETLSFNEGNAVMELLLGNLDMALVALRREHSRRYPARIASDKEIQHE